MLSKFVLDRAKSFLCWDFLDNLSIQLVEINDTVAYFYPPQNRLSSIVVFYESGCKDFTHSLYLLFHEVGHYLQYSMYDSNNQLEDYWRIIQMDRGEEKVKFESQAWALGRDALKKFAETTSVISMNLLDEYTDYGHDCIKSYQ